MEERAKTLGKRLYTLRTEQGLSMQELADKVGVNKSTVYKWEHGLTSLDGASSKHTAGLASALGVSPAYIRGEKDTITPAVNYELRNGSTVVRVERTQKTVNEDRLLLYSLDILAMQSGFHIEYTPDGDVLLVRGGVSKQVTERDLLDVSADVAHFTALALARLLGGQS